MHIKFTLLALSLFFSSMVHAQLNDHPIEPVPLDSLSRNEIRQLLLNMDPYSVEHQLAMRSKESLNKSILKYSISTILVSCGLYTLYFMESPSDSFMYIIDSILIRTVAGTFFVSGGITLIKGIFQSIKAHQLLDQAITLYNHH